MAFIRKNSFPLFLILFLMSSILIHMFFYNFLTDIIVTVFLGLETIVIVIISLEIMDVKKIRKRTKRIIEIYFLTLLGITVITSYLFY
ncbi:hypothetical protein BJM51_05500 [Listeria monocytogenes]|nr:hypothetical protein [Listeria monocytogenes]EAD5868562.1 hypothetical protein [Listeria innocua]EAC3449478.1 hypothetical protein [Listeria monocytogenes]EAC3918656.1 hypothetical protein [Listeria monocytogenes]EAC7295930.1 hypothetical protein [Listeria monocytogenes]